MKRPSKLFMSIIASLALLATAACGGDDATEAGDGDVRSVRMTIPLDLLNFTPLYVARYHKWFEEKGINLDVISTGGGGPDVAAVLTGDSDFSFTASLLMATQYQEGAEAGQTILGVMNAVDKIAFQFIIRKEVLDSLGLTADDPLDEKLEALEGLTIGVSRPGAFSDQIASYYIRRAGYTPGEEVTTRPVGAAATALAALEQGQVDIHGDGPPVPQEAITQGFAVMFIDPAAEDPVFEDFSMQSLVVRPQFAEENPDVVRDVVEVLHRANEWILEHDAEELAEVLSLYFPLVEEEPLLLAAETMKPLHSETGCYTESGWENLQEVFIDAGSLEAPVAMDEVATNEFLPVDCP